MVPITPGDPRRALLRAEPRHRPGRGLFRPGHAVLVRDAWPSTGLLHIADDPGVLTAINPALRHRCSSSTIGLSLAVLGAVCPSVTGAEALYADLGHFGRRPIRTAWLGLVFPALVLNYFGQGALVLAHPDGDRNPVSSGSCPTGRSLPMVMLATACHHHREPGGDHGRLLADPAGDPARSPAAPRDPLHVGTHQGQIYLPRVNMLLLIGVIILVLDLPVVEQPGARLRRRRSSARWSVDAVLAIIVIWKGWRWPLGLALALMRALPAHRPVVLRRQPAEALHRRLCAGRSRLGAHR